jgi:hypothetical protein
MLLISAALATPALGAAVAAARSQGPVAHTARVGSKIVLFKSVAGIKIGMTPKQAKRKLGRPSHTIRVSGKISEFEYEHGFQPTIKQLKHAYGKALHKFPGGFALYKGKSGSLGSSTTQFTISGGKVDMIDVQKVFNDLS